MAPTETIPEQVFGVLPAVSSAPASEINSQIHKDNRSTVITIATMIAVAIVLSLLGLWIVRQRLVLSGMLSTMHQGTGAKEDAEASTPDTREELPEWTRRWRFPNFSAESTGEAKGHEEPLPSLPEIPTTTDDLKKLGQEVREAWSERGDSLHLPRPGNDVGLQRASMSRFDETGSCGRSLTVRPHSTAT